jgi:hypothetical protein
MQQPRLAIVDTAWSPFGPVGIADGHFPSALSRLG